MIKQNLGAKDTEGENFNHSEATRKFEKKNMWTKNLWSAKATENFPEKFPNGRVVEWKFPFLLFQVASVKTKLTQS